MAHAIPPDFISLAAVRETANHSFSNVIGIVVDIMPTSKSRKDEYMLTFKLLDLKLADEPGGREGFTVRFFDKDEDNLPKVRAIGDAVHLRQLKKMMVSGEPLGLSNFKTRTVVVPSVAIPTPEFSIGFQGNRNRMVEAIGIPYALQDFGQREQEYIIRLRHSAGMITILQERIARMSVPAATLTARAPKPIPTGPASMSKPIPTGPASLSKPIPTGPASMTVTTARLPNQQRKQKHVEEPGPSAQPPAKKTKMVGTFGPKFKLIEELRHKMYADLCGIIVKKFPAQYGTDLYITDYTSNEAMRYYPRPEEETDHERDGDTFGYSGPSKRNWPGPYEWLVLKVNLKYPHASYANEYLNEGDCVVLQNVKGRDGASHLEGDLWPESDNPGKLKISKLTDGNRPEIQAMRHRQEQYWALRKGQPPQAEKETSESKAENKKAAKKRRKREEKAAQQAQQAQEAAILAKKDINPNVRSTHQEIDVSRVEDILDLRNLRHTNSAPDGSEYDLPFINANYRAKVRVVDFEPKDLEDFAIRPEPEHDSDDSHDNMDWTLNSSPPYEWYFSLLLEDASIPKSAIKTDRHRIWVQVHHGSAQFLLGNVPNPDDMQHNTELLAKLREKLFLLWGNLEEDGGENLSNLPFECVIKEYGIPLEDDDSEREETCKGCKRMYAMEGATIL